MSAAKYLPSPPARGGTTPSGRDRRGESSNDKFAVFDPYTDQIAAERQRLAWKKLESACKPGSVEDDHSSGIAVTGDLKRPTRKRRGTPAATFVATSLFGLAPGGVCRAVECCHRRGALLPHRFTLTVVIADA